MEKIENINIVGEMELPKLDVRKYVGKKVVVEKYEVGKRDFDGKVSHFVKFSTIALDTLKSGDGKTIEIRATKIFGLQRNGNSFGWGKNTKLGVFMSRYGASSLADMRGKDVIIQLQPSKVQGGQDFLTFE